MAEIHVQTKRQRANPAWMWTWLIIGILIIAAVVYFVYTNKNKNDQTNTQDLKNQRNTPQPGAAVPSKFLDRAYVMNTTA
jgi:uncharacterized protein HemX